MIYLLYLLLQAQTLAPPPINFTREKVVVDGKTWIVAFENNRLSIEEEPPLYKKMERAYLKWYVTAHSRETIEQALARTPPDNQPVDGWCLPGCLCMLGVSALMAWTFWEVWKWIVN